jgi:hypothetical protein
LPKGSAEKPAAASAVQALESLGSAEQAAVNGVNDRLRGDLPTAKEATVQALNGFLTARDSLEFEVDVALSVRIQGDMNNLAVLVLAFGFDVVFELFDPGVAFFSVVNRQDRVQIMQRGQAELTRSDQTYFEAEHIDWPD